MTESFAQLFEESLASQQIRPGQILTGTVVAVTPDVVIVSVGVLIYFAVTKRPGPTTPRRKPLRASRPLDVDEDAAADPPSEPEPVGSVDQTGSSSDG